MRKGKGERESSSSYEEVFDSEKDSQTDNPLTLLGKTLVTMVANTEIYHLS